jgi:hypothetical protein
MKKCSSYPFLFCYNMIVNESIHTWFQINDNLGRVTLNIIINIKTSKIFLGVFGRTFKEHKMLQHISKNETPIGMDMGVSFSRRMGISFCKMSCHFFPVIPSHTYRIPVGYHGNFFL